MKKKFLCCCLFGAPAGLTVFMFFMLTGAYLRGDGEFRVGYYLLQIYGTEVNAVTAACIGAMAMGMIWSTASLIYQTDWNLLVQTLVHAAACMIPSLMIARAMYWMPRNREGLLQYAAAYGMIYAAVWALQYLGMRKKVRQMNALLQKMEEA